MTTAGDQGRKIKRGTQDLLLWLTGVGILHWHYWQDHQLGYCFIPAEEMLGMVLNHPELLYLQPTVLMSFLNRKQQHLVGRGCGEKLDLVKRKTVFRTKPSSLCALCRGVRTTKKKQTLKESKISNTKWFTVFKTETIRSDVASLETQFFGEGKYSLWSFSM